MHQCVKCGNIYQDGAKELLRGCTNCNGKKFFYTQKPISKEERRKLSAQANKDFSSLVQNILSKDIKNEWTTISKEEIIEKAKEVKEGKIKIKTIDELEKDFEKEEYKKEIEEGFLIPKIITKLEEGVYEIDLKALMENVSIIMQKDGSYKVHFPKKFKLFK